MVFEMFVDPANYFLLIFLNQHNQLNPGSDFKFIPKTPVNHPTGNWPPNVGSRVEIPAKWIVGADNRIGLPEVAEILAPQIYIPGSERLGNLGVEVEKTG
jgi:hypothetical protein